MKSPIWIAVSFLILIVASPAYSDCIGCCSGHGGVVCIDGVTMCGDGTPLSQTCIDKGCEVCIQDCTHQASPLDQSFPYTSGEGTINVTVSDPSCSWSATTDETWIDIVSGTSGTSEGTITFTVDRNYGDTSRTGFIIVEGETVSIAQSVQPMKRDMNGNRKLDMPDVLTIFQIVADVRTNTTGQIVSLEDAIYILQILVGITPVDTSISIASFNIQTFGISKSSDDWVMSILAAIIQQYDVVAIQEIRDISGSAIEQLEAKVDALGVDYEYVIGPRVGRTDTYKEQYAFMYRVDRLVPGFSFTFDDDVDDLFEREPFVCEFIGEDFDFVLINIHTDPDFAAMEIDSLPLVVDEAKSAWPDENEIFVLGDFNADGSYFDEDGPSDLKTSDYVWLITNDMDTNVATTSRTYDRIVMTSSSVVSLEDVGVFYFDDYFNLTPEEASSISDHYPVFSDMIY